MNARGIAAMMSTVVASTSTGERGLSRLRRHSILSNIVQSLSQFSQPSDLIKDRLSYISKGCPIHSSSINGSFVFHNLHAFSAQGVQAIVLLVRLPESCNAISVLYFNIWKIIDRYEHSWELCANDLPCFIHTITLVYL